MNSLGKTTIKGLISDIQHGEKRISRSYTYGYMVLTVRTNSGLYSVLINSSKINTYGFLPKVGQKIKVEGIKAPARDGYHDYSMSHVSSLEHIKQIK